MGRAVAIPALLLTVASLAPPSGCAALHRDTFAAAALPGDDGGTVGERSVVYERRDVALTIDVPDVSTSPTLLSGPLLVLPPFFPVPSPPGPPPGRALRVRIRVHPQRAAIGFRPLRCSVELPGGRTVPAASFRREGARRDRPGETEDWLVPVDRDESFEVVFEGAAPPPGGGFALRVEGLRREDEPLRVPPFRFAEATRWFLDRAP